MSETLLEKLGRIEKELTELKAAKQPKQIDYSEGISILEGINKELTKKFSDLNAKYYELNKELLIIKNKKPVEQIDYSEQINALDKKINVLNKPKIEPVKAEIKKEIVHIDHSKELLSINNELSTIKQKINKKQEFDIKAEVEKVVNIAYVTHLYRNK
jgi:hypothetical protein